MIPPPISLVFAPPGASLDEQLAALPDRPAVFLLYPAAGDPLLSRAAFLRRRLKRLLSEGGAATHRFHLRGIAQRAEWWPIGSRLEASLVLYELAREHFPDRYEKVLRLRFPYWVKLILANPYPRTQVVGRLGSASSLHYGPFRSRQVAEQFESGILDGFQLRRCAEDLQPTPTHPGCIYGEMNLCSRPCQEVVSAEEYAAEAGRVRAFFLTSGKSLVHSLAAHRDKLSEELEFEEAARQHKRIEQVEDLLRLEDGLAGEVAALHGVAVVAAAAPLGAVNLWFLRAGCWLPPIRFCAEEMAGRPGSMDRWLRERVLALPASRIPRSAVNEHVALLARWYFSSWRDGLFYRFASFDDIPYRSIVRGISRVAAGARAADSQAAAPPPH